MSLTSPKRSHASKGDSDDGSDITEPNFLQEGIAHRKIKKAKRRLPPNSALAHRDADDESKNICGTSPLNVSNNPQSYKVTHTSLGIPNNYKMSFNMSKLRQSEAQLPYIVKKPEPSLFARSILKLDSSLPLLNHKAYIDDWSASLCNQSLPPVNDVLPNNNNFDPYSFSSMEYNQACDRAANSSATSKDYESIDYASISVSTIDNDDCHPFISQILESESSVIASSYCDPLISLYRAIDIHDKFFDPTSISSENIDSAPNLVANKQLQQTGNFETVIFNSASNLSSQNFNVEAVNLDPLFNWVPIPPPDQSFQSMFNSFELADVEAADPASFFNINLDTQNVDITSKSVDHTPLIHSNNSASMNVDLASMPDEHAPPNKNIDLEANNVDSTSKIVKDTQLNKTIINETKDFNKSVDHTPLIKSNNSASMNVDLASVPYENAPPNQNIDLKVSNIDPKSEIVKDTQLNKSINNDTKIFDKSVDHTQLIQSNNFASMNVDLASVPYDHAPPSKNIDLKANNVDLISIIVKDKKLNQTLKSEIKNIYPKSQNKKSCISAENTTSNHNINLENKNVNVPSKSVEDNKLISKLFENKMLSLIDDALRSYPKSFNSGTENVNHESKSVEHELQNQNVKRKTKKNKKPSKTGDGTTLNQNINFEHKTVDVTSKSVEDTLQNQSINNKTKNVALLSKLGENKILNQNIEDKNNKSLDHTLPMKQLTNSTPMNVDSELKLDEHAPLNKSVDLKVKNAVPASKIVEDTQLNRSVNSEITNVNLPCKLDNFQPKSDYQGSKITENIPLCQNVHPESQSVDPVPKSDIKATESTNLTQLHQSVNPETKNVDPAKKLEGYKPVKNNEKPNNKKDKLKSLKENIKHKLNRDKSVSKLAEREPINQNVKSKPEKVNPASTSSGHLTLSQSINSNITNVDQTAKSVGDKPLNEVFQPLFNSSAISSLDQSMDSALISVSSIMYSESSFNSETKSFAPEFATESNNDAHTHDLTTLSIPYDENVDPTSDIVEDSNILELEASFSAIAPLNDSFDPGCNSTALDAHDQNIDLEANLDRHTQHGKSSPSQSSNPVAAGALLLNSLTRSQYHESFENNLNNDLISNRVEYTSQNQRPTIEPIVDKYILQNQILNQTSTSVAHKPQNEISFDKQNLFNTTKNLILQLSLDLVDRPVYSQNIDTASDFDAQTHQNQSFHSVSNSITDIPHQSFQGFQGIDISKRNQILNIASTLDALPLESGIHLNEQSSVNKTAHHNLSDTVQNQKSKPFLKVVDDEPSCYQSFYTSSDFDAQTHQNQSFYPVSSSVTDILYNQRFQGVSNGIDLSTCNKIFNKASTPVALPPQNGIRLNEQSSMKKSANYNLSDTAQNPASRHSLKVVNDEPSCNQSFYTALDSDAPTHQNQSFYPISNSITHTPHKQRFQRSPNTSRNQIVCPAPISIGPTSHNQSFYSNYNSAIDLQQNQNFDSDPALNKPLPNIQRFFSQFKSKLSPASKNFSPASDTIDDSPAKTEIRDASGFNEQLPRNPSHSAEPYIYDIRPAANLSSTKDSQSNHFQTPRNKLLALIKRMYPIPLNIDAPSQNAQQKETWSSASNSNVQPSYNSTTWASPSSQDYPVSDFVAQMQQKPASLSESIGGKIPSHAERFYSIPNIVLPQNIEHSPQNNSFDRAPGFDGQPTRGTSAFFGFASRNQGDPTSKMAAVTQHIENIESDFNAGHSSHLTSRSSSRTFSPEVEYFKPIQSQPSLLTNLPKFVTRVQQSPSYEQISSFNAFAPENQKSNSTFNHVPNSYRQTHNPSYGHIATQCMSSSSSSTNLPKQNFINCNMAHFEGQPPENQYLNPESLFNHKPSLNKNSMPPGFERLSPQNKKLNPHLGQPLYNFSQPSPQKQNKEPEPGSLGQINRNFNLARDVNQERLLNQNFNSVPDSSGKPPNNNAPPATNQNVDSASIFNTLSPNIQRFFSASKNMASPHNQSHSTTTFK